MNADVTLTYRGSWTATCAEWSQLIVGTYNALAWFDGAWCVRSGHEVLAEAEARPGLTLDSAKAAVTAYIAAEHAKRQQAAA